MRSYLAFGFTEIDRSSKLGFGEMEKCFAIILAGGSGLRFGSALPKQYVEVRGKPIIGYTIEAALSSQYVNSAVVVCACQFNKRMKDIVELHAFGKEVILAPSGDEFIDSLRSGINSLGKVHDNDLVVILSGDRPLVSVQEIDDAIVTCRKHGSGIAALPASFCALRSEDGTSSVDYLRNQLYVTVTPWAFLYGSIKRALDAYYSGELGVVEPYPPAIYIAAGNRVFMSKASRRNIKITHQEDIGAMERYLSELESEE